MTRNLEQLFSPITINGMDLKNRAVMPAMGTSYANEDSTASERLIAYLARRARGGTGLIITEVCAVDPRGKGFPRELGVWDDSFVPGLQKLTQAVHEEGAKIALQLHHAGRETFEAVAGALPEGPSDIPSVILNQPTQAMSVERVQEIIRKFANAAVRAKNAGFDAVELHGAHGYLLNQFLSPFSNNRDDAYGGSDENRARFVLEIIQGVRSAVGGGYPILVRISASEAIRNGYDLPFAQWLAPKLVKAGADAIHVSVGVYSTPGNLSIASMDTEPCFNLFRARAVKDVVDVPVIGVGRINDPALADEAIACGDADLISFGRQHLTDPDFLEKARTGRDDDIMYCIACNQGCIERLMFELKSATCVFNPECGQEYKGEIQAASKPLKVWVVGAGPAGVAAAYYASRRGHTVELYEAESMPGGQLLPASQPPHKEVLRDWLNVMLRRLEREGVSIICNKSLTADMLEKGRPDAVILTTGARSVAPGIPGIQGRSVVDARDVLLEKVDVSTPVVILGAGYVGMETADFLLSQETGAVILEMKASPPVGKLTAHGYWLHKRIKEAGGRLVCNARVLRIEDDGVVFEKDGEEIFEPAATVITALGAASNNELEEVIKSMNIPCRVAGDAVNPRRFIDAIHEGYRAGKDI